MNENESNKSNLTSDSSIYSSEKEKGKRKEIEKETDDEKQKERKKGFETETETDDEIQKEREKEKIAKKQKTEELLKKYKPRPGFLGNLNEKQEEALKQLRKKVEDVLPVFQGDYKEQETDSYLLRYLRGAQFDLEKAEIFIRNEIKWRAEKKPELITKESVLEEFKTMKFYNSGVDKEGRPVLIVEVARHKKNRTTSEEMINLMIYVTENAISKMEYPIENVTIIFNVKNMGWSNFDYSGSKEGAFILMNYYVERLGKLFFINMGWIFSTLYKIGKSWIDPETQTKKKQKQLQEEKKEKEKKEKEKKEKEEKVNTNQKSKSFSSDKDNKHDSDDDSDDFESMQSDDEK
ncbi:hypothetical protein M0811_11243 [Anaeramoeba ignava]|uniref:CRAL-TRIO domain-containing protein n=1 Tax=Anaeramoeba ignava TaxID=1746090 RepID=A0A9Q0LCV2_ANAIG|nr:hypothetical protein M0811_11243 [Anaeramoeba ignava]